MNNDPIGFYGVRALEIHRQMLLLASAIAPSLPPAPDRFRGIDPSKPHTLQAPLALRVGRGRR